MADSDVLPLPLTDEDDFFSDLGSDDPYSRHPVIGSGRLVIDVDGSETTAGTALTQIHSRPNPFSTTEPRARNINLNHNDNQDDKSHSTVHNHTTQSGGDAYSHGHGQHEIPNHNGDHYNAQFLSENPNRNISTWDHCHVPAKPENNTVRNQLIAISIFTTLFGIGETIGAIYSGSIAIGTDVMHLASDLLSFVISLIAVYLAKRTPTARLPWGFHRAEVLGALLSVFVIWVVTGILVFLAVKRIMSNNYSDIDPDSMLYTSIAGVCFNIVMAIVLNVDVFKCQVSHGHSHDGGGHGHSHGGGHGHSHDGGHSHLHLSQRNHDDREQLTANTDDENEGESAELSVSSQGVKKETNIVIRAAFVHVLGDLIQSVGVLVAAIIIKVKEYRIADPICTFTFSVLVLITTVTVLRDAFFMLMEGRPKKIPYDSIHQRLSELPGVIAVHSLKIWALTATEVSASAHIAVDASVAAPYDLVKKATSILRDGEMINRTTVQIEPYNEMYMRSCMECRYPAPYINSTNMDII